MAYVELHGGLSHHAKLGRLMRSLKIQRALAVGHLACLWSYCIERHPGGLLRSDEVEAAAEWEGEEGVFLRALCACRWLDEAENGMVMLHNWADYTRKYLKSLADYDRKKRRRSAEEAQNTGVGRAEEAQNTGVGRAEEAQNTGVGRAEEAVTRPDQNGPDQTRAERRDSLPKNETTGTAEQEIVRRFIQLAVDTAKCPSKLDTIRSHLTALVARNDVGAAKLEKYLMSSEALGRTVNHWHEHFDSKNGNGKQNNTIKEHFPKVRKLYEE